MKEVLSDIQDGTFAKDWLLENKAGGRAHFLALRRQAAQHPLETVGAKLRDMMPWLHDNDQKRLISPQRERKGDHHEDDWCTGPH